MKLIIVYFVVLASATFQPRTATATYENTPGTIDQLSLLTRYAGMGYNALQANPEGDFYRGGVDPGIKTTRFIFNHTYCERKQAFYNGQAMQVPDQVEFHATESCSRTSTTNAYSGQTSYKNELSLNVDASGSYEALFSAHFSLSIAMSQAREKTENQQSVVVQKNRICNYGQARYKLANALSGESGYSLTEDFKNAVRLLPSRYSVNKYTRFLDDWGTHVIETASIGTRDISRSRVSYLQVYEFLSQQNSGGVSAGGSAAGASGSVSINIDMFDQSVNEGTRIGESLTEFMIGSAAVPLPIHTKVVMIVETLADNLWAENERTSIQEKKMNLERALREYATNKGAQIAADPFISIQIPWPIGQFSLIEAATGCPSGMSSGWRYQDNEDTKKDNHWRPADIDSCIRFGKGINFKTYYCTKTSDEGGFSWPRGKYCIARYGGSCPSDDFFGGSMYWDDEDTNNDNDLRKPVPDGKYNGNTKIEYCCRSDGNPNNPMLLPPTQPFALYRYDGKCQKVLGMNDPIELFVQFDDEDSKNDNSCSGNRPDGPCNENHGLYLCYYHPNITTAGQTHCANFWYKRAVLTVKVRKAKNLDGTDPGSNKPEPYVVVEALSEDGKHTIETDYISGTVNPTWNRVLNFGCRNWESFLTLRVWDYDNNPDDPMSAKEKVTLSAGNHKNNRHNAYGSGYMIYDYNFDIDGDECRSSTNGGPLSGNLRVRAAYGRDLPDEDPWLNDSDPYMEVIAIDDDDKEVRKVSSYVSGDLNPDWSEWLNFGTRSWKKFKVRIYDSDNNADDPLSDRVTWTLSAYGSHKKERLDCNSGYVIFDYSFFSD